MLHFSVVDVLLVVIFVVIWFEDEESIRRTYMDVRGIMSNSLVLFKLQQAWIQDCYCLMTLFQIKPNVFEAVSHLHGSFAYYT